MVSNRDTTRSQQFTYDQVNRLVTGETTSTYSTSPTNCWGEAYVYDNQAAGGEFGNLTNINAASTAYNGCTQESLGVTASSQNQITAFSYDASGNVLNDTHNTYAWNAEAEIKTGAGINYTYDGDGNRVQKSNGKLYWYGAGSQVLDESDASGNITDEYVFLGGKRIAHRVVSGNAITYYVEDMLGTSRAIVTPAGILCYDADFYPFGGERAVNATCAQNYKFEGKERDAETSNDDFGARYYSSAFGRWTSPDWSSTPAPVPYANLTNPQTLNLYAMVRDNPESFADLDGHYACGPSCWWIGGGGGGGWAGDISPDSDADATMNAAGATLSQIHAVHELLAAYNQSIQGVADSKVGTNAYLQSGSNGAYGCGTNKCNELVADSVEESGRPRPQFKKSGILGWLGFRRDPTAHEWADPNVNIPGWSRPGPVSGAAPGDVIAQEHGQWGHTGIVVLGPDGSLMTVSVNSTTKPAGIVTRNDWGFRPRGQNGEGPGDPAPVVRRYVGDLIP